jgi:Na+/melibiose symporter-like transporter
MSKIKSFFADVKEHWSVPDSSKGRFVPYKEYLTIFTGVAMNYGVQSPLKYLSFAASCYLIMYHYRLPYVAFSIIALIGMPLTYLWNILGWVVKDNLGILDKKTERKYMITYASIAVFGLLFIIFDLSTVMPAGLTARLDSLSGINAMSFFKIIGVQLFVNAYTGLRDILWRKKLVPKYGRYKYSLFANYFQKCVVIILLGWLPINEKQMPDVYKRLWIAYLLFMLFTMFDFGNVIENCTQTISPNPQERLWVRTWPVKLSHLLENIFTLIIPLIGIAFDDIRLYRYVLPAVFIVLGALTLIATRSIKERIPQPPLAKKQKVSFWYGVSQVMRNKYRWLDMFSSLIDSLGNGALTTFNIVFFFSMRMYTQGILYGVMKLLNNFKSTPLSFAAPYFIRKFSYRTLKIFKQICHVIRCVLIIVAVYFFKERQELCGWAIFFIEFIIYALISVSDVAQSDMNIRLGDYQMYLSGERLESSAEVFKWFINPITTVVSLIIPLIVLRFGFNSNWDVLFIDGARFGIIAVPILFDLVGHVLMIFPYIFWDYNNEKHNYVMEVLKQREKLANEGYFPAEYEGGLSFMEAEGIKNSIPANTLEMLERREEAKASVQNAE